VRSATFSATTSSSISVIHPSEMFQTMLNAYESFYAPN
jgi:hypothetical protein